MAFLKPKPVVLWDPISNPAAGVYGFKRRKAGVGMGLLRWIKKQWDDHRDQRDEARFNQGYHWAARYLAHATEAEFPYVVEKLEGYVDTANLFESSPDKFDDGIKQAISDFENKTANRALHRAGGKPPPLG